LMRFPGLAYWVKVLSLKQTIKQVGH
jgi:hypothetical protein